MLSRGRGRQDDLVLVAVLLAIVALLVLPLPTALLDVLIAANLTASLALLIVAMYVPSALSLSTFPSLLLFTTLFRLSLNIASTKLILLHAEAGHIIETFGRLIVEDNVVVGGVVFLIIAIVQFIVIAKGSERVAEVAARFALDAMPGKQMSIDADVRAGLLTSAQAQARREQLEQECALHGAMDGAMKFVKGDAIASIVIALVNVLAGVAIGTLMHGMGVGEALQRYAILTVGDGMVSQIPSLLVSIAAGVVITRVDVRSGRDVQLARQIGTQLTAHPRALVLAGAAAASFLLVPGFPKWVFGLFAAGLVLLGVSTWRRRQRSSTPAWMSYHDELSSVEAGAIAPPLAVRLSAPVMGGLDRCAFDGRVIEARQAIEADLGPVFPRLQVVVAAGLADGAYEIVVHDVAVARGALRIGHWLVDPAAAQPAPTHAQPAEPFGPFDRVAWVDDAAPGAKLLSCEQALAVHVGQAVRAHVARLLGLHDVQRLLHQAQREAPELAAELVRTVPTRRVADVLRRLLQEGVPVRNLHAIFESIVAWAPKEPDAVALTELVRIDLGRCITSRHVGLKRELRALLFEASLMERVRNAIEHTPRGNLLLLDPAVSRDVREQVRRLAGAQADRMVALTACDVRRYIKTLIEPVAPSLPVLSYQEIDEDVTLQPLGWIMNPAVPAQGAAA
jgi:type III secretion protein V